MTEQELYDSGNFGIMQFYDKDLEKGTCELRTIVCWDGVPFVASKESQRRLNDQPSS